MNLTTITSKVIAAFFVAIISIMAFQNVIEHLVDADSLLIGMVETDIEGETEGELEGKRIINMETYFSEQHLEDIRAIDSKQLSYSYISSFPNDRNSEIFDPPPDLLL